MRFKIDENLPTESVAIFEDAGHDALTIHDQRMVGEPDTKVALNARIGDLYSAMRVEAADTEQVVRSGDETLGYMPNLLLAMGAHHDQRCQGMLITCGVG